MLLLKALLPGLVASALFWMIDKALLRWGGPAQWLGMAGALVVFTVLSLVVLRRREARRRSVASRRRIGGDSHDTFDDVRVGKADEVEVLSGNVVRGNSTVSVGRLDIE